MVSVYSGFQVSFKRGQTPSAKIQGGGGKYKSKGWNPISKHIGKANCYWGQKKSQGGIPCPHQNKHCDPLYKLGIGGG